MSRKVILLISLLILMGIFIYIIIISKPKNDNIEPISIVSKVEIIEDDILIDEKEEISIKNDNIDVNKQEIFVETLKTERLASNIIQLKWENDIDDMVDLYIVKKRLISNNIPQGEWKKVETIKSGLSEYVIEDKLATQNPVQYEYRVDVQLNDSKYKAIEGKTVRASNIMVCIDPGHYAAGESSPSDVITQYTEGVFVLEIAKELKNILKEKYGIDSYMTREGESISLGGYIDKELDKKHISLRGKYASLNKSDLFISLHTNANKDDANGYEKWNQPIEINKTIIILNTLGLESENILKIANSVGINVTKINFDLGISNTSDFQVVSDANDIIQWTDEYNDGLNMVGSIVRRVNDENKDYYGVLRGATEVGISGMLIEHGHHTIEEYRKISKEDLAMKYAEADAYGIAYGYGFVNDIEKKDK